MDQHFPLSGQLIYPYTGSNEDDNEKDSKDPMGKIDAVDEMRNLMAGIKPQFPPSEPENQDLHKILIGIASGEAKCHAPFTDEEARLLYVAQTRAKNVIDISECNAALLALDDSFGSELRIKRQKDQINDTPGR